MHLKGEEMARTGEFLDELEAVLAAFRQECRPIRIERVAQGEGLDLLREGFSRHANQIRDLARRFESLTFVACQNSIDRISRDQGIEVNLLPQAVIASSGVSHVAKRQVQGWAYIHI